MSVLAGPLLAHRAAPSEPGDPAEAAARGLGRVYLAPGRLHASGEDVQVTTILGSCVAVGLWDARAQVGGVNHFLLPSGPVDSPRFGETAMPMLFQQVLELGGQRARLTAKVFGGACVLEAFQGASASLGMRNVEVARQWLREAGIPIVGEDAGGLRGRKLVFHIRTGAAWVRPIEMKG